MTIRYEQFSTQQKVRLTRELKKKIKKDPLYKCNIEEHKLLLRALNSHMAKLIRRIKMFRRTKGVIRM